MIVPFAAGGPNDTIGRILAERMWAPLGQPVIIENVVGANDHRRGPDRACGA
jgi:tripartite-type tricarboxylate transporter receptor subunit TctC